MQQARKENLFEFSITGIKGQEKITPIIEELFENNAIPYEYEIRTQQLLYKSKDGIDNLNNIIEIHQNISKSHESEAKEFTIDVPTFFNNVEFLEKIDEYFLYSKYFIKYIANTIVNYSEGCGMLVEFSRCKDKIDDLFKELGYKEIGKIRKRGEFIKFKNLPIFILNLHLIDNFYILPEKEKQSVGIGSVVELICYCKESEKEIYLPIISQIKAKLLG